MKESIAQAAILDYLRLKGYFHWRNNTGAFKNDRGGFYRFGTPGSPDIFVLKMGKIIGIEVKSPTGILSVDQEAFRDSFTQEGGIYIMARSIDDLDQIGL